MYKIVSKEDAIIRLNNRKWRLQLKLMELIQDIEIISGLKLDMVGSHLFKVYRNEGEPDVDYRERIGDKILSYASKE